MTIKADDTTVSQEAMAAAMQELETMEKSLTDGSQDEVDTLVKALDDQADQLADEMAKSHKEPDGDEDEKGKEPLSQEEGEDVDLEKSLTDKEVETELVKASEAFEALEKSIFDGMDEIRNENAALREEVAVLAKSVNALLGLNVTSAKVIGALTKSVQAMGAEPMGTSRTVLGIGGKGEEENLTKSRSEVQEALTKAIQEQKIDARWLSIFGVKGIAGLTEDVKTIIGC